MVWLVFAPGNIAPGALAGNYVGATASATVGVGAGANVLLGGSSEQVTLQPVSVEGSVGLNVAAGIGEVELSTAPSRPSGTAGALAGDGRPGQFGPSCRLPPIP